MTVRTGISNFLTEQETNLQEELQTHKETLVYRNFKKKYDKSNCFVKFLLFRLCLISPWYYLSQHKIALSFAAALTVPTTIGMLKFADMSFQATENFAELANYIGLANGTATALLSFGTLAIMIDLAPIILYASSLIHCSTKNKLSETDKSKYKARVGYQRLSIHLPKALNSFLSFYASWIYLNGGAENADIAFPFYYAKAGQSAIVAPALIMLCMISMLGPNYILNKFFNNSSIKKLNSYKWKKQAWSTVLKQAITLFLANPLAIVPFFMLGVSATTSTGTIDIDTGKQLYFGIFIGLMSSINYFAQCLGGSEAIIDSLIYVAKTLLNCVAYTLSIGGLLCNFDAENPWTQFTHFVTRTLFKIKITQNALKLKQAINQSKQNPSIKTIGEDEMDYEKVKSILVMLDSDSSYQRSIKSHGLLFAAGLTWNTFSQVCNLASAAGYTYMTAKGSLSVLKLLGVSGINPESQQQLIISALITALQFDIQTALVTYDVFNSIWVAFFDGTFSRKGITHANYTSLSPNEQTEICASFVWGSLLGLFSCTVTLALNRTMLDYFGKTALANPKSFFSWGGMIQFAIVLTTATFNIYGLIEKMVHYMKMQAENKAPQTTQAVANASPEYIANLKPTAFKRVDQAIAAFSNLPAPKQTLMMASVEKARIRDPQSADEGTGLLDGAQKRNNCCARLFSAQKQADAFRENSGRTRRGNYSECQLTVVTTR